jgi:hypothetical protein
MYKWPFYEMPEPKGYRKHGKGPVNRVLRRACEAGGTFGIAWPSTRIFYGTSFLPDE